MKVYLEATELVSLGAEFIRSDVTGLDQVQIDGIQADMESIMAGKTYQIIKHYCHHPSGSCRAEIIKNG